MYENTAALLKIASSKSVVKNQQSPYKILPKINGFRFSLIWFVTIWCKGPYVKIISFPKAKFLSVACTSASCQPGSNPTFGVLKVFPNEKRVAASSGIMNVTSRSIVDFKGKCFKVRHAKEGFKFFNFLITFEMLANVHDMIYDFLLFKWPIDIECILMMYLFGKKLFSIGI